MGTASQSSSRRYAASSDHRRRWSVAAAGAVLSALVVSSGTVWAQAAAVPRQTGTVKSISADGLTLTTAAGQEYVVTIPASAPILDVPPGAKDLATATAGKLGDVAVGDKVLVTGSASDTGNSLTARRVIVMKSAAIADAHAAEDAAWAKGVGGIVKSVDAGSNSLIVSAGMKPVTVTATPTTQVRRYANGSVQAQDAVASTVAAIQPGDQMRARGTKSADGSSLTADAILVGSFKNYSGLVSAIDAASGTITLKDLATKKSVTVAVTPNSNVRRLPEAAAMRLAMQIKGQGGAGAPGAMGAAAGRPPSAPPGAPAGMGAGPGGTDEQRAGRARGDLAQMLDRLPTETIAGLKPGEAVMIVAMPSSTASAPAATVTLLAGVEPILQASPNGQAVTLPAWSLSTSGGDAGGGPQ